MDHYAKVFGILPDMKSILPSSQAKKLALHLQTHAKTTVVVGGCFDILHLGHVTFLEKAKQKGDCLIVLLESDQAIKKRKGEHRPIRNQAQRARMLSSLRMVDYVILLPQEVDNDFYDQLMKDLRPKIIATTKGDSGIHHKKRQAKAIGAKVLSVVSQLPDHSTTRIEELLSHEL